MTGPCCSSTARSRRSAIRARWRRATSRSTSPRAQAKPRCSTTGTSAVARSRSPTRRSRSPTGSSGPRAGAEREIVIEATLAPQRPVERPGLRIEIRNERGGRVFLSPTIPLAHLVPGVTPRVRAWVEDRLHPGDYSLGVWVVRPGREGERRARFSGRDPAVADPGQRPRRGRARSRSATAPRSSSPSRTRR